MRSPRPNAKSPFDRPAVKAALEHLESGHGDVLMVSKLDRLTRSVHDATGLMLRAEKSGGGLVALDVAVDATILKSLRLARVLAAFAELERRLTAERTKAGTGSEARPGCPTRSAPSTRPWGGEAH